MDRDIRQQIAAGGRSAGHRTSSLLCCCALVPADTSCFWSGLSVSYSSQEPLPLSVLFFPHAATWLRHSPSPLRWWLHRPLVALCFAALSTSPFGVLRSVHLLLILDSTETFSSSQPFCGNASVFPLAPILADVMLREESRSKFLASGVLTQHNSGIASIPVRNKISPVVTLNGSSCRRTDKLSWASLRFSQSRKRTLSGKLLSLPHMSDACPGSKLSFHICFFFIFINKA